MRLGLLIIGRVIFVIVATIRCTAPFRNFLFDLGFFIIAHILLNLFKGRAYTGRNSPNFFSIMVFQCHKKFIEFAFYKAPYF